MLNFDRHIAFQAGWIAGPAFGVAMMAAPEYLHLSPALSGILFWGGIGLFIFTIFSLWILSGRGRKSHKGLSIISLVAMLLTCSAVAIDLWDRHNSKLLKEANLEARLAYTLLGQALVDGRITPALFVFIGITNSGSVQSAASNFGVSVKKDGSIYQGTVRGVPKTVTVTALMPAIGGMQNVLLHDEDALYNKASTPIPAGGVIYGFLMVSFSNISDFNVLRGGFEVFLTFNDAFSKQYSITQIPSYLTLKLPLVVLPGMHTEFP